MDRYAPDYNQKPLHTQAFGNAWTEDYGITIKATATDKIYFGIIPAGVRVAAVRAIFDAAGAGATLTLGFEPTDPSGPVADIDAWLAAADIAAAGAADSKAHPITFNQAVKLVGTVGATAFVNTPKITVVVDGKMIGVA